MALAYVWGLILAIYLMGHGLVSIPRSFFRRSNNADTLRRIQAHAPKIHDRLTDAVTELEEVEAQVAQLQRRKTGTALAFEDWIEELADYSNMLDSRPAALHSLVESTAVPAVITERYLASLSRRLQRARHQKARFVDEWDRLVRSASDYQTILNAVASKKLDFGHVGSTETGAASHRRGGIFTPYMRYIIYVHILPSVRLVLGTAFAAASFCVVWSEIVKTFAPKLSIISLSLVPNPGKAGQIGLGGQLIASLWLLYMCTAALRGVNDAQVWGNRALVRRNTYGESACWYAGQVARLTVPLAYNFLTFLPDELRHDTTFYQFLGQYINLTPLGKGFDYFFPIFLLVPVFATMFNLYGRIKKVFGLGFVDDEEDSEADPGGFGTGGWREGRALIERELVGLGSLGLTSRSLEAGRSAGSASASSSSLNIQRAASPQPGWSAPSPVPRSSSRAPLTEPSSSVAATTATTIIDDGINEEENLFQSFAHRVRNTIDTASTPRWLQGGLANISTPKWLNTGQRNPDDSNSSVQGGSKIFEGLFGQRSSDGHVRL